MPLPALADCWMRRGRCGALALALLWAASAAQAQPAPAAQPQAADAPRLRVNTGAHTAPLRALDVDRAGRYAVTAAEDGTARVWDLGPGQLLQTLRPPLGQGNEGKLFAAAISPDAAVVAVGGWSANNDVYLFDRSSGVMLQRITQLPDVITQLAFSPDGKTLAIGLWGRNGVWQFRSDSQWRNSRAAAKDTAYEGAVYGLGFSADGKWLATAASDGAVRVYAAGGHVEAMQPARSARPAQGQQPFGLAWSPDGSLLAVGFADAPAVAVLRADTLQPAYLPSTDGITSGSLNAVAWSSDGRELLAAGTWKRADGAHGLRRWAQGGRGAARDDNLSSNSVVGLRTLADGRVLYASADPAWGWRGATAGEAGALTVPSGLADFRQGRNAFRVARDGSAIAFALRDADGAAVVSGFNLVQGEWTAPQPQWMAPVADSNGITLRDWFDSTRLRLNQRVLALMENEVAMSVAVAPDNAHFALGTSNFLRYHRADGSTQWRVQAPGTTWQVNVTGDGRWVVAAFSDGTLRWYRAADGSEQLALLPHPDRRRWVMWTPAGYYSAAPGAEDLIGWHLNRGQDQAADFFPASRFRGQFYRPDVIAQVLASGDGVAALRQANAQTGREAQQVATLTQALPPVVEILSPASGVAASKTELTLRLAVRAPADAPVLAVKVRVNGLLQQTRALGLLAGAQSAAAPAPGGGSVRELAVTLPAADADIQVFAENRNGVSQPAALRVKWAGSPAPTAAAPLQAAQGAAAPAAGRDLSLAPKLYVLAVGMSRYRNADFNLQFAAKDAQDFAQALARQKGVLYRDVQVRLITDDKASKDDVLDGLEWLKREVTARDLGILFMAGHGVNDNAGNYYFMPHNANPEQLLRTGISQNDIKVTLNSIAGKALFFIDTCHSGNALGTARTRGALVDVNAVVNDLASAENAVIVFAASTGRQYSQESPDWNNGAFTKAVVEGLTGQADFRKTGTITHKALDFYVAERVKELTKGQQSPVSIAPQGVTDFPIALVGR